MTSVPQISVLVVGGTGESWVGDTRTDVSGMLERVTANLDSRFSPIWVPYPASYGPATQFSGMAYDDSVRIGCANLASAFEAVSGPVMLLGYSQGAVVVRRLIAWLSETEPAALGRIVGAGLVADPHQPVGVVDGCDGFGVAGAGDESLGRVDAVPAYWVGAADDMICNASADSLIRDVADLTGQLGFTSVRAIRGWLLSVWEVLRSNRFQNSTRTAVSPAQWRRDIGRLAVAVREVSGYLPSVLSWRGLALRNSRGGRHTSYAAEPYRSSSLTECEATGCEILARWMQVEATFTAPTQTPIVNPTAHAA
ncbi:PE-PPE domain-containing protein [Gordonia effusa]|uniref:PE-PPE domain-containing protein n=1 Tax=Gordonia effusa TaxID=263908 RepID=UPI0006811D64|nr:PE-PPE domain-containing protein [Gordonia effusa]